LAGVVQGHMDVKVRKVNEGHLHLQCHRILVQKVIVVTQDRQGHPDVQDQMGKTDCPGYLVRNLQYTNEASYCTFVS